MTTAFSKIFERINIIQVAFYLIACYFTILLLTSISFLFNSYWLLQYSCVLSLLAVAVAGFFIDYKKQSKPVFTDTILNIGAFLAILLLLTLLSVLFWDNTYDGQTYHLQAIDELAHGWNPLHTESTNIFVTYYPKAFEKFGAAVFECTGEIETGKVSGLMLVTAACLLAFSYFKHLFPGKKILWFVFTLLLVINPIISTQNFTFLIDGQLASIFLILIFSFLLYLKQARFSLFIWLLTLAICIDLKFTGLVYAGVFQLFAGAYLLFIRFRLSRLFQFVAFNVLLLGLSIFVISNNPYYTNIKSGKHIFYPVLGTHSVNFMAGPNSPASFQYRNRFSKFFIANFSRSGNVHGALVAPEPELKIPFFLSLKEFTVFKSGSVLYGGFGPLFGGILIVSFLLILYILTLPVKNKREFLLLCLFLLVTIFLNPECWLARYVPQLWYLPVLLMIFIKWSGYLSKMLTSVNNFVFVLTAINGCIIFAISMASNLIITNQIRSEYAWMKSSGKEVALVTGVFKSTAYRLEKYQINYQRIDSADRAKYTGYYVFNPISSKSEILIPESVKPYEPGKFFSMLESYIKTK
ncbi:hypothetical protein FAM09_10805 [Niastella caeni]|uniref:Glycosyltransferase RgtA/B/C/D-like domain-containing protein n=1 Tax=Niastella caeni TaxID=2569763 RepID=A0A4S8HZR4_9BACT|nr:hypothetical protein [Niastella caeni]THU40349.1 hypothetical protein FAM09_10805 [Niastella caeni]